MNSYHLGSDITIVLKPYLKVGRKKIFPAAARGYIVTSSGKDVDEVLSRIDNKEMVTIIPADTISVAGKYKVIFQIEYSGYGTRPHSVEFRVTPSVEGKTRQRKKKEILI